jgi:Ca2+-transporting ATPase
MPEGVPIQMGFKHVAPNWLLYQGERDLQEARTAAFTVLVLAQLVHACNCRSAHRSLFSLGVGTNMMLIWAMAGSVMLQMTIALLPATEI